MATHVLSFMEEDSAAIIGQAEEWNKKVNELGLSGQKKLSEPDKSPIPFRWMDAELTAIIEALCPSYDEVAKYDKDPLPMQVLGHLSLCEKEGYFEEIRVRYHAQKPDPFLIGKKNSKWYLICQWGQEKLSLDELKERAKQAWMENAKATIESGIARGKAQLESLDSVMRQHFNGQWVNLVS